MDYLFHLLNLVDTEDFGLVFYLGVGGLLAIDFLDYIGPAHGIGYDGRYYGFGYWPLPTLGTRLAARVPIGLSFTLEAIPLEFYGEVIPTALLFPGIGLGLGGAIGARFYFY